MSQDSTHRISVVLTNQTDTLLKISTEAFLLHPGPLAKLALVYSNSNDMPGPDTLVYPDGAVNIYARGYDQWGNLLGIIQSNWTQSGTLHPLAPPTTNQINVYYDASNSMNNEAGWIKASAPGAISGDTVSDSAQIIIIGRGANLSSAITKDINGNGYLDQIWLTFDKSVSASLNSNIPTTNVSVAYTDPATSAVTTLIVDSIQPVNIVNDTSSSFIVHLHDNVNAQNGILERSNAIPQTSWCPLISISGINGANTITNQRCQDGAGPVIWSVVLTRNSATDRSEDFITVTFSEPIQTSSGDAVSMLYSFPPGLVFSTWKKQGNILELDTSLLACNTEIAGDPCIASFYKIVNTNTVQFCMTNKNEIDSLDYFNIRIPSEMTDQATSANLPVANNQRVKVEVLDLYPPQSNTKSGCGCGSGTGLAFIPPIGFKAKSWWSRKRKGRRR